MKLSCRDDRLCKTHVAVAGSGDRMAKRYGRRHMGGRRLSSSEEQSQKQGFKSTEVSLGHQEVKKEPLSRRRQWVRGGERGGTRDPPGPVSRIERGTRNSAELEGDTSKPTCGTTPSSGAAQKGKVRERFCFSQPDVQQLPYNMRIVSQRSGRRMRSRHRPNVAN